MNFKYLILFFIPILVNAQNISKVYMTQGRTSEGNYYFRNILTLNNDSSFTKELYTSFNKRMFKKSLIKTSEISTGKWRINNDTIILLIETPLNLANRNEYFLVCKKKVYYLPNYMKVLNLSKKYPWKLQKSKK